MRRIRLAVVVVISLTLAPLMAEAQQAGKVYRIGVIDPGPPIVERPTWEGFVQELRDAKYTIGKNIVLEMRRADRPDKLQAYAEELVRLRVDLIMTGGTPPTHAAKQATSTIPVVFYNVGDPVGSRLVATLSRPGGNLTGLTHMSKEINSKRVELLKETVPSLSRLGVLAGPGDLTLADTEDAARALGLRATTAWAQGPGDLEGAFAKMVKEGVSATIVLPNVFFFAQRQRIAELAMKHRLPTMYEAKNYVDAGGLMSYGASWGVDTASHLGTYVVKILKGAKPADLPVEQPTKFELVINLKTAKALGLTIPQTLLQRADQVIQ